MMYSAMRKLIIASLFTLLAACQTATPDVPNYPAVHFTGAPFSLNVANIQIVQEYTPSLAAPNLDHISPITPSSMVRTWANDRLTATGRSKTVQVVIKDASIVEKPLPRTEWLTGMFTTDESALYQGHLQVKLEIYGNDPLFPAAEITANVSSSTSISEDASVNERQQVLYALSKKMIEELNGQMERNINQYFGLYLGQ